MQRKGNHRPPSRSIFQKGRDSRSSFTQKRGSAIKATKKRGDDDFVLPSKFNEDSGSEIRVPSDMEVPTPEYILPTKISQEIDFMGLKDQTSILQQTDDFNDRLEEEDAMISLSMRKNDAPFEASDAAPEEKVPKHNVLDLSKLQRQVQQQSVPKKKKKVVPAPAEPKKVKKTRPQTTKAQQGPIQMQIAKAMLKNITQSKKGPVMGSKVSIKMSKEKVKPSIDAIVNKSSKKKLVKNVEAPKQNISPKTKKKKAKVVIKSPLIQPIESQYSSYQDEEMTMQKENQYLRSQVQALQSLVEQERQNIQDQLKQQQYMQSIATEEAYFSRKTQSMKNIETIRGLTEKKYSAEERRLKFLNRRKEIEKLEQHEEYMAHQREVQRVQSQEKLLNKQRERSKSILESLSMESARKSIYQSTQIHKISEDSESNVYGSKEDALSRRQRFLAKKALLDQQEAAERLEEEQKVQNKIAHLQKQNSRLIESENEMLRRELQRVNEKLRTVSRGHNRKMSLQEKALVIEILPEKLEDYIPEKSGLNKLENSMISLQSLNNKMQFNEENGTSQYYSNSKSKSSKKDRFANMNQIHKQRFEEKKKEEMQKEQMTFSTLNATDRSPFAAPDTTERKPISVKSSVTNTSKKLSKFKDLNSIHMARFQETQQKQPDKISDKISKEFSMQDYSELPPPKLSLKANSTTNTKFKSLNDKLASRYQQKKEEKQDPVLAPQTSQRQPVVENSLSLTPSELEIYGDRFPPSYKKIRVLGKGAKAIVWLGEGPDNQEYAFKQFAKKDGVVDKSVENELLFSRTIIPDIIKSNKNLIEGHYEKYPLLENVCTLVNTHETNEDKWLIYEMGPQTLSQQLCIINSEQGQYSIQHGSFYTNLEDNPKILAQFIVKVAQSLQLLTQFEYVHCDLKPDNILFNGDIKLIDFGSSFKFKKFCLSTATPEYLAPELLNYLGKIPGISDPFQKQKLGDQICQSAHPWSFDIWSLGIILIEIITGFPVWLSIKCKMTTVSGKQFGGSGILAVKDRNPLQIMNQQSQFIGTKKKVFQDNIKKNDKYRLTDDNELIDLIHRMLSTDPKQRISPAEILEHPYCNQ